MKTLTKNQKKTAKTPKPSTPDRLAAFKALSASRLDAIRAALKNVKSAERRIDEVVARLDSLQARCFDGMISPVDTANEIGNLMENAQDAWGNLEDAQFVLNEETMMGVKDFTDPVIPGKC
jgi:hypothetical protein